MPNNFDLPSFMSMKASRAADPLHSGKLSSRSSAAKDASGLATVVIVTPTYNSEKFLDDAILSVVSQSGDFILRYHIQDGGSNDDTLEILRRWERLLRSGDFPILCAGLTFSYESAPDKGMYQAINRGVAQVRPDAPFLMGWINSDDRLAPGALAAISGVYGQFPEVSFTCARVSMIDQHGVITGVNLPVVYDRQRLSEGAHDGRTLNFVMQEGCFWRSSLWDQVGGLDERFRLAGDWDLWRRFAHHAALYTIDSVLGFHRRHFGQLSADLTPYHAEIDAIDWQSIASGLPVFSDASGTLKFDINLKRWESKKPRGAGPAPPIVHYDSESALSSQRVEVTRGARMPEGPYPEANLPGGMRWIDDEVAEAVVIVPYPGLWRMHLRIRNWRPDLRLVVMRGSTICLDVLPRAGEDSSDTLLVASLWLEGGRNELSIRSEAMSDPLAGWLFVLLDWYVLAPVADNQGRLAAPSHADFVSKWAAISIILCSSNQARLDLTFDSITTQGYPDLQICVVDDASSGVNRQILAAYAAHVDRVVTLDGAHRQTAIGRAIDLSNGMLIVVLTDSTTLAPGALFALSAAFRNGGCDLVTGITVDVPESRPVVRRLLSLPDGCISVEGLLRLGLQENSSNLFDRGALFLTRRIWQAAGATFQPTTPGCAAFDFWVRCAKIEATVRTLPIDLVRRAIAETDNLDRHRPDADVRRHAEALAQECGVVPAQISSASARSTLKIFMLDVERVAEQPTRECRWLATALAVANQRVTCLVDDTAGGRAEDHDAATSAMQAIVRARPELVILVGDGASAYGRAIKTRLGAARIPMIAVSDRSAAVPDPATSQAYDPLTEGMAQAHDDVSSPAKQALAPPYGTLSYGFLGRAIQARVGDRTAGLRACVDTTIYIPRRRAQARRVLGLPLDAFIVLAAADNSTKVSVGLAVTIEAYDALKCDAKLLVVLGYREALPSTDAPIIQADDHGVDDVNALFYAAADVVASSLGDDRAMSLVYAAASGTPTLVASSDQDACEVREAPFGLRLSAWMPRLVEEGLQRLYSDVALHRRLSRSGPFYARSHHSLEACAWSLMTLMRELRAFRAMHLAAELVFPATAAPVALESLQTARSRPFLTPRWQVADLPWALSGQAANPADGTKLTVSADGTVLYLRAHHGGPQRLRVCAASRAGTLVVTVSVNGEDCGRLELVPREEGFDAYFLRAPFFSGLNRIELTPASETQPGSNLLLLQSLDLDDELEGTGTDAPAPHWQPLIGFAEIDQLDRRGAPNHWIDGPSATLRIWSRRGGVRCLRLFLKNYGEPQSVEVVVNGAIVGVTDVPTTNFLASQKIFVEVVVWEGWNLISLELGGVTRRSGHGHDLVMRVSNACLTAIDDPLFSDVDDALGPGSATVSGE